MPLPSGITTATVTFGAAVSYLGTEARIAATLSADRSVVHAATGMSIHSAADGITAEPGLPITLQVPHVDQPGFIDSSGSAVTGWAYILQGTITFPAGQVVSFKRMFQALQGQTLIDLDVVPDGPTVPAVSAPTASVLSVAGLTGTVTPAALVGALEPDLSDTVGAGVDAVVTPVAPPSGFPALSVLPMPTVRRLGSGRFKVDLDFSALRPAAGVTYYVGPGAIGSGTSAADPGKIADVVAKPDVGTIVYLPGVYRRESSALAAPLTKSLNHIAAGPGVRVTAWNANLAWTLTSGNIYQATRSATQGVVDITNLTARGDFTVYEKKADLASITGPGQWATVGSTVYVWPIGNTNLSTAGAADAQIRLAITITGGVNATSATRQYVKGIDFEGLPSGGLVASGGAVVIAVDCTDRYVSGLDGAAVNGAASAMILIRTSISSVGGDGASYRGAGSEFIEIDCSIRGCGVYAGATNNNATTAHAGARGIRIGGDYETSGGPVMADVNDAKSWNLGCRFGRSELANSGSVAAEAAGYDTNPATVWLDECELEDSDYAFRTYPGSLARIHTHATRYRARLGTLYPTDTGTVDFYTP